MKAGVADEFRTNGASGARSRFHSETFQTQRCEARGAPHSQHGDGSIVPPLVHVQECGNEALSEQTDLKSVTEHNRMGCLSKTFINANEGYTRHVLGDLEQWMTVNCV